eukprot:scaffold9780_cov80-Skeletonema_menzelii.AAC.10
MTVASANTSSDKTLPVSIAGERGGNNSITLVDAVDEQQELVKSFVEMLGDTPPRLEVDFAVPDSYHTSSITLD